jgi:alkanesulfonate monooxygenase SsuD/methylene tetrahydromethanopterin reductase-like flavin-dependent oxidoreductase (luciferase family)
MELGLFMVPNHPPERDIHSAIEWDLQVLRWADEYGYSEAWIGEHFTLGWEPVPSPDLLIAQALRETSRIKLAAGAHLLPYHHPVELALRIAFLDQLARGRYMIAVGSGAFDSDARLFGTGGKNESMTREALEIMIRIWEADGPFEFHGEHWNIEYPEYDSLLAGPKLKPYQKPYPPIALVGGSPRSSSLRQAGERGFMPVTMNLGPAHLATQWEVYEEGAQSSGRTADRRHWRVAREFFVADTDADAYRHALGEGMGRAHRDYLLPLFAKFGMMKNLVPETDSQGRPVTAEYLAEHVWLVGSPETVAQKLRAQHEAAGGFGVLLGHIFDHSDDPEPFRRSLELMATEVMPRVQDLAGA